MTCEEKLERVQQVIGEWSGDLVPSKHRTAYDALYEILEITSSGEK